MSANLDDDANSCCTSNAFKCGSGDCVEGASSVHVCEYGISPPHVSTYPDETEALICIVILS